MLREPGFADSVATNRETSLHRGTFENAVNPSVEVLVLINAEKLSRSLPTLVLVTDTEPVHPGEEHHVRQ